MTEEIKGVPQPLPDHECKYCKTVHAGCCSKACVLKKSPNYPLPSVLTESRPQAFTTSPTSGVHAPVAVSADQPLNNELWLRRNFPTTVRNGKQIVVMEFDGHDEKFDYYVYQDFNGKRWEMADILEAYAASSSLLPVGRPVAVSTDQPQPLAELPRKLAEKWRRCVGSDDLCQELERDIRRAMLEFAERAEQSIKNCVINDREYFAAAIRELAEELDNDSRMQLLG